MLAWMLERPDSAAAQLIVLEFDVYLTLGK